MSQLEILDDILLSDNVVTKFYDKYRNDVAFKSWIDAEIPYVKQCEEQQQNNPWHIYNVLEHILHSVESMNKQTKHLNYSDRRILAYTMFFHDMGKPEAHIERIKDGKLIDSFFNHNINSERIAGEILPKLKFSEEEINVIKKLVYKHDIFMFIKLQKTDNPHWRVLDDSLINSEIEDLNSVGDGEKLLRFLILVGRSDNFAQNEKMTAESLKMLEHFEKMLMKIK